QGSSCVCRRFTRSSPSQPGAKSFAKPHGQLYQPTWKGFTMTNRSLQYLLKLSVVISAAVLALSARADLRGQAQDNRRESEHTDLDNDRRGDHGDADDDRRGGEHADDDRREHERLLPL